jgi:hypothetical protein
MNAPEDDVVSHHPEMSSGRLLFDRVARQHCPSLLHWHEQINMHSKEPWSEGDISTVPDSIKFNIAVADHFEYNSVRRGGSNVSSDCPHRISD